jgi:hypothetical protein
MRTSREYPFTWEEFEALRRLVVAHTGIVVADTKFEMFYSRLARRLRALGLRDFQDYLTLLRQGDQTEIHQLINAITTNLTGFFREPHHFEFLARNLVPDWAARPVTPLRIWSAGCASGEEPYSIAMVLLEHLGGCPPARSAHPGHGPRHPGPGPGGRGHLSGRTHGPPRPARPGAAGYCGGGASGQGPHPDAPGGAVTGASAAAQSHRGLATGTPLRRHLLPQRHDLFRRPLPSAAWWIGWPTGSASRVISFWVTPSP